MQVGETFIKVRADTSGFSNELERGVSQGASRASTSLGQVLTAGAAVAGFQRLISASSDLNESVNVTGLVFDQSEDKIAAFAEGAAQSIGQSERAARTATATFGGLLENVGFLEPQAADTSIALTRLASDLGSAFNKDPEEAVVALTSALRGETEPIRAFNVQLDDMSVRQEAVRLGLAETTAEVDQQGLVQGRLSLIMEQTSAVQGDFANTSTEAANAQRIAAAEAENSAAAMGDNFLPAYKSGLALVQAVASGFGALPGPIQTAIVALGAVAALRGPVGNALGFVADGVRGMQARFTEAGGGARGLSAALTPGALGTVAAAGGLALITSELADQAAGAAQAKDNMDALADAFEAAGNRGLAETLLSQFTDQAPGALDALDDVGIRVRDLVDAITSGEADPEFLARFNEALASLSLGDAARLQSLIDGVSGSLSSAAEAEEQVEASADGATSGLDDQVASLQGVADAADEARDKLDALFGIQQSLDESNVEVQASADALRQSLRENGNTFNVNTQRGRDNLAAARDAATAIREQTIAYRAQGASVDQASQSNRFLTESLRQQLRAAGLSREETDDLIETYGRVPRRVLTDLDSNPQPAIDGVNEAVGYAIANWAARTFTAKLGVSTGAAAASIAGFQADAQAKGFTIESAAAPAGPTVVVQAGIVVGDPEELGRHLTPIIARELDRGDRSD